MNNGYIALHRKILDWEWYSEPVTRSLFIHLILIANFTDKKWNGIEIGRGQVLTGRFKLAQTLNFSEMQIRTALKRLKSTSDITIKTTNKYSIITIKNYDQYQSDNQPTNQRTTNKQPTNNQQITTTNKDNKDNKDNNTTNVVEKTPPLKKKKEYGMKEINELISYVKNSFNVPVLDGTVQATRRYAYNLLVKFKHKNEPDYSMSFKRIKKIIDVGSKHKYWKTRISSMQKLYNNAVDISLEIRRNNSA